jgi:hypothetical protein
VPPAWAILSAVGNVKGATSVSKHEILKFLCGFLAGVSVVHASIGLSIAAGLLDYPGVTRSTWDSLSPWVGAAFYLVLSVLVGVTAWRPRARVAADLRREVGQQ